MGYEDINGQEAAVMCDEEWGLGMPDSQHARRVAAAASQMRALIEPEVTLETTPISVVRSYN